MILTSMNGGTQIVKDSDVASSLNLGADFEIVSSKQLKDLKILNGVVVKNIRHGLLSQAGIKDDFIITKIDQKSVNKPDDISTIISNKKGGILIEGIYPSGIKAYYGIGL